MAGGSGEDNPVGINVTAMVDIIFCLCLFFMCSLKFRDLDGVLPSWLPSKEGIRSGPAPAIPEEKIRILLAYDLETRTLQRMFFARPIPEGPGGDALLRTCIRQTRDTTLRFGRPEQPVIIDSGPSVPWAAVVDVMNLCREEDVIRVEFACG